MRYSLLGFIFALATSCFVDGGSKTDPVQNGWEERLKQIFSDDKNGKDAYALLSSSSYVDNGQTFIVDNGTTARLYRAQPGEKAFSSQKQLTSEQRQAFLAKMANTQNLTAFEPKVFDGVQYEFIHFSKTSGTVIYAQRFAMNNPDAVKSSEAGPYKELVAAFRTVM